MDPLTTNPTPTPSSPIKLNTVLLIVLILLIGFGIWKLGFKKEPTNHGIVTVDDQSQQQTHDEVPAPTTYTYSNHGITMELPTGFVPHEEQSEGGPAIIIRLSNNSELNYYTNASWWEKYNLPEYTYLRDQKIGTTTFKVYITGHTNVYWFKQGNVGYEFFGDTNLLSTFKFVGWAPQTLSSCLHITSPVAGQTVSFPLTLTGYIDIAGGTAGTCTRWGAFEGVAGTAVVKDTNGNTKSGQVQIHSIGDYSVGMQQWPVTMTIPSLTGVPYTNQIAIKMILLSEADGSVAATQTFQPLTVTPYP